MTTTQYTFEVNDLTEQQQDTVHQIISSMLNSITQAYGIEFETLSNGEKLSSEKIEI